MPPDPLASLRRLRNMAVDTAQSELAACCAKRDTAAAAAKAAEARIQIEMAAAASLEGGDGAVEAFARWLPHGRANAIQARRAAERAEAECGLARSRLTAARTAREAVDTALRQRTLREEALAARKEQEALDEAALRVRPPT